MLVVTPIVTPKIDWEVFNKVCYTGLGRSVTASLDRSKMLVGSTPSYIAALGEFQQQSSEAFSILRNAGPILRHLFVSFLVKGDHDVIFEVALEGSISILESENDIVMASATMDRWHAAVINYCSPRASKYLRAFGSNVLREFDRMGLTPLWENFSRKGDTTNIVLLEKK